MNYTRSRSALAGALAAIIAACLMGPTGGLPARPTFQTVTAIAPRGNTASAFNANATSPEIKFNETDVAADEKRWSWIATGADFHGRVETDDGITRHNFMDVTRTGLTIDQVNFNTGATPTEVFRIGADSSLNANVRGANAILEWTETDAGADLGRWVCRASGQQFVCGTRDDDDTLNAADQFLTVDRIGSALDAVTLLGRDDGVNITATDSGQVTITGNGGISLNVADNGAGISLATDDTGSLQLEGGDEVNIHTTAAGDHTGITLQTNDQILLSAADGVFVNVNASNRHVATVTQGTYTGTITGCTTAPTITVVYTIISSDFPGGPGGVVTLYIPTVSCTSNSTSFTVTGGPAAVQPNVDSGNTVGRFTNNGADTTGPKFRMSTAGTLVGQVTSTDTSWTNVNAKGIANPISMTYALDNN